MSVEGQSGAHQEFLSAARLLRIAESAPTDIFVAGYPKSGNTWVQYLVTGLLFGVDVRVAPDLLVQDLVPNLHYQKFYRRYLAPTFFKTHDLPQPQYRRVIYLVRDGRDVMVSYFHHISALENPPDFLKLINTGEGLFPCRWHEHIEAWTENPHGAQMITISYEMLKENPLAQLKRICDFANIERDQNMLESVARNATFDAMRERERKFGWANADWPKDKAFVRRGRAGSFKDEMPAAALEAFMRLSAPALSRFGYL